MTTKVGVDMEQGRPCVGNSDENADCVKSVTIWV